MKEDFYYIETHMHTSESSTCGSVSAADGVRYHKNAGFDGVIITDHFNRKTLDMMGNNTNEQIQVWLKGYKAAKSEGDKKGIDVYLGAEFAFTGDRKEYILFGITEEHLPSLALMFDSGIEALYEYSRSSGILIIQAHPFRTGNGPAPAGFIDGAETYNGNLRHKNDNPLAKKFCETHGLLMTAGGDYHEIEDLSYAMRAGRRLGSIGEFAQALKNGELEMCEIADELSFEPVK